MGAKHHPIHWILATDDRRIAGSDHESIPIADADFVRICDRNLVVDNAYLGHRIVHHGMAFSRAGGEVMAKAERMTDFVRRELAHPGEREGTRLLLGLF